MHAALQIEDILQEIIFFLDIPSLTSLTLICRSFYRPAKEAIWARQSNLSALISLVPADLIVPGPIGALKTSMKELGDPAAGHAPFPVSRVAVLPREMKINAQSVDSPPPSPVPVNIGLPGPEVPWVRVQADATS